MPLIDSMLHWIKIERSRNLNEKKERKKYKKKTKKEKRECNVSAVHAVRVEVIDTRVAWLRGGVSVLWCYFNLRSGVMCGRMPG